ncbi:MAG: biotin--[acetyl-CoA-carboxylase] ligase [Deltaproteobacteria bacterium]|jgi:BirA family biotin operon repressor/biotin-[acetyl-CoA-carboxylase] ligase|nr:biotin--[acetyl-CoA-carboxylase] ligase [Deltaproteobacteria bacterium]
MTTLSARDTILKLFRKTKGCFLSSAQISSELGVSRNAVWKQIENLRELGYQIKAVPSQGYQLVSSPDTLLPEEIQIDLETKCIGREIRYFPETDSTNLQATKLGESGAVEGLVVIADQQSQGKGRLGRKWISPPNVNLYASILLRPRILPSEAPQLTFLSAVGICRAIEQLAGLNPKVKWPNDITLHEKKVAGLLNEMNSETDQVNFVVLGMGVNLNMSVGQFPKELAYPATSLAIELGHPVSRIAFTRALLHHIDLLYSDYLLDGISTVRKAWTERCDWVGRRVEVNCHTQIITGVVQGLGNDGALLVATECVIIEEVLAGDVQLV